MQVAFLGLGAIGEPMAAHLASPGPLVVWNRTSRRAEQFASVHHARAVRTPREAATGSDVMVTCLPTSREVEALLDGPDGLLAGARAGTADRVAGRRGDPRLTSLHHLPQLAKFVQFRRP